jgi:hypothetical protein
MFGFTVECCINFLPGLENVTWALSSLKPASAESFYLYFHAAELTFFHSRASKCWHEQAWHILTLFIDSQQKSNLEIRQFLFQYCLPVLAKNADQTGLLIFCTRTLFFCLFKSPNKIVVWYLGNWSNTCSNSLYKLSCILSLCVRIPNSITPATSQRCIWCTATKKLYCLNCQYFLSCTKFLSLFSGFHLLFHIQKYNPLLAASRIPPNLQYTHYIQYLPL